MLKVFIASANTIFKKGEENQEVDIVVVTDEIKQIGPPTGPVSAVQNESSGQAKEVSLQTETEESKMETGSCTDLTSKRDVVSMYTKEVPFSLYLEKDCPICLVKLSNTSIYDSSDNLLSDVRSLKNCQHMFHLACIKEMVGTKNYVQCPICKKIHGVKMGDQPEGGEMEVTRDLFSLPGYPSDGTIRIKYHFQGGIQGPNHPHPGKPYSAVGFPRFAFLPDNEKGRLVLRLLQEAFRRRLIFTVGQSVTSGRQDCVTWNEIHHKTSAGPGSAHGYPDASYLDNVVEELALQGVTGGPEENNVQTQNTNI